MYQGIRPYVTSGIALVGASVVAVSPMTVPPPEVHVNPIATTQRVVAAEVQLTSLTSLADYTFADAALLTGNAVFINLPLLAVVLPTTVVIGFVSGVGVPELAGLVVGRFVTIPLDIARPWAAALANSLPEPLGGVPVEDSDTPGQGIVFDSFHAVNDAVRNLLPPPFGPNLAVATQAASAAPADDEWPPDADTAGRVLSDALEGLVSLPTDLITFSREDQRAIGQYLDQGRALDAIRLVVHRSIIDVVEDLARPNVQLATTLLPPPVGGHDPETGFLARVSEESEKATQRLLERIEPDPPESVVEKTTGSGGPNLLPNGSGRVLNLKLPDPDKKVGDNVLVTGNNPADGTAPTKSGNAPRVGDNGRTVIKQIRHDIRETVKDVRQGVRDVVKAVTGIGKKKDDKQKDSEPAAPKTP
jgi:hypothetical protein